MMLIPIFLLVLAFNGGLYMGTILFSAYDANFKNRTVTNEGGLNLVFR